MNEHDGYDGQESMTGALIASLGALAAQMIRAAITGLVILALGLVAVVAAIIAAVTTLIGWILRVLADLIKRLLPWLPLAARWLTRLLCTAVAVGGIAYALPLLWSAYGHDLAAALPAAVLGLAPLLAVLTLITRTDTPEAAIDVDRLWPALLVAGIVPVMIARIILAISPALRIVLLAVLLVAIIVRLHLSHFSPPSPPIEETT